MGFLTKILGSGERRRRRIDRLKDKLDAFMRPSQSLVDSRDMNVPERRSRYALFVYGAINALAEEDELDETERLAILVMFLRTTAQMHEQDVSMLVGRCMNEANQPGGQVVMGEGLRTMRQWLAGEAGMAVSRLSQVLKG
jgi:hypothetical protein